MGLASYKILPDEHCKIIDLYNNGCSTNKIALLYNVNGLTIGRILKKNGINIGRYQTNNNKIIDIVSTKTQDAICEKYLNRIKTTELAKEFGLDIHSIRKIIKSHGIKIRGVGEDNKKYLPNAGYFDLIDDEYKAYFLGLLFADGSNNERDGNISIGLMEQDKSVLELMSSKIFLNHRPIYIAKTKGNHNSARLYISDARMKDKLESHGVIPRKSLILEYPYGVFDDTLFKHFLRGYFDGDGCITVTNNGTRQMIPRFSLVGTELFLSSVKTEIEKHIGVEIKNKLYKADSKSGVVKEFKTGKKSVIYKIYRLLYDECNICLDRKKKKFEEIVSKHINEVHRIT